MIVIFFFQELAVPLRTYVEIFPNKKFLHPYECSLIELTFGEGNYEKVFFFFFHWSTKLYPYIMVDWNTWNKFMEYGSVIL